MTIFTGICFSIGLTVLIIVASILIIYQAYRLTIGTRYSLFILRSNWCLRQDDKNREMKFFFVLIDCFILWFKLCFFFWKVYDLPDKFKDVKTGKSYTYQYSTSKPKIGI
jgi:hypothetical protein